MCNPGLNRGPEKDMSETIGKVLMRSVDEY